LAIKIGKNRFFCWTGCVVRVSFRRCPKRPAVGNRLFFISRSDIPLAAFFYSICEAFAVV
jgi:hypothetical protein